MRRNLDAELATIRLSCLLMIIVKAWVCFPKGFDSSMVAKAAEAPPLSDNLPLVHSLLHPLATALKGGQSFKLVVKVLRE